MERSRTAPPPSEDEAPLPLAAPPPPRLLLEEVRSPGVSRADVDALLRGLSGPLAEGESARERADVLLDLLQDTRLRELTGSDARPLGPAALEALLALGFPYALEVPPNVLAELRPGKAPSDVLKHGGFLAGLALPTATWLVETLFLISSDESLRTGVSGLEAVLLVLSACTTMLPTLLAYLGASGRNRLLSALGVLSLGLVGLVLASIATMLFKHEPGIALILLGLGAARLVSAVLLWPPEGDA